MVSHLRRSAVWSAAGAVAVVVALLVLGSPARGADVIEVRFQGLADQVVIGGSGEEFRVSFNNTGPGVSMHAVFTVRLEGASPDSVHLRRRGSGGGTLRGEAGENSTVIFNDNPFDLSQGDRQERRYILSFDEGAVPGEVTLGVGAIANGQALGTASATTMAVARGGQGPSTPPNTDPGYQPTFEAGSTQSYAPLPQAQEPTQLTAEVPRSLYWLGGLLVVLGLTTLVLIFRAPGRIPTRAAAGVDRVSPAPPPIRRPEPWAIRRAWPTISRGTPPRPPRDDGGPHTGTGRPIRDPGTGDSTPPWLRP